MDTEAKSRSVDLLMLASPSCRFGAALPSGERELLHLWSSVLTAGLMIDKVCAEPEGQKTDERNMFAAVVSGDRFIYQLLNR